ncbi:MAG: hypothetical protein ACOYKM_04890 [Caulobacterales bacterium]
MDMEAMIPRLSPLAVVALALLWGCGRAPEAPQGGAEAPAPVSAAALTLLGQTPPDQPALPECAWQPFEGAGIVMWTQTCPGQRMVADAPSGRVLREAVEDGALLATSEDIRVLDMPASGLAGLTAQLMLEGGAPAEASCTLNTAPAVIPLPQGRQRYSLEPTGLTRSAWEGALTADEVPETPPCGRYGVSHTGYRYIEIQAAAPTKALFVELGSEVQLFEPNSIQLSSPALGQTLEP